MYSDISLKFTLGPINLGWAQVSGLIREVPQYITEVVLYTSVQLCMWPTCSADMLAYSYSHDMYSPRYIYIDMYYIYIYIYYGRRHYMYALIYKVCVLLLIVTCIFRIASCMCIPDILVCIVN